MSNPENENPYAVLPAPPSQADPDGIPGLNLQGEPRGAISPESGLLPFASPWSRLGANVLDRMLVLGGGVAIGVVFGVLSDALGSSAELALVGGGAAILGLIGVQVHHLVTRGQTIGKRALGLRIVDADGNIPAWSKLLIAREGSRYGMGFIPYLGVLLGLADALMIFSDRHQTLHDRVAGTYVVLADGTGVPARAPGSGTGGASTVVIALVVGFGAIFMIGIVAAIAIPNFIAMQMKAKRAEVPGNLDGIRVAEIAYEAANGQYTAASSEAEATAVGAGKQQRDFPYEGGWRDLGWRPDGQVRGVYWVELTPEGFAAYGACDVDGDGDYAVYVATERQGAQLTTPGDVY